MVQFELELTQTAVWSGYPCAVVSEFDDEHADLGDPVGQVDRNLLGRACSGRLYAQGLLRCLGFGALEIRAQRVADLAVGSGTPRVPRRFDYLESTLARTACRVCCSSSCSLPETPPLIPATVD